MPATAICPSGFQVEISEDGTLYTDISDWVRRIDPGERTRANLIYNTATGPKTCPGTPEPVDIELEALYTEGDTDPFTVLRDAHYAGTPISVRWQVVTGPTGKQWTAANAYVLVWDEPEVNADSDEPLGVLATINAQTISWLTAVA
jgi:hypothetical protein